MNKYNVWNKWDKLETVLLGDTYNDNFYQDIKNPKIRGALQRIADETKEDLAHYENVLKDFGCNVLRPKVDQNDNIMNYINLDGKLEIKTIDTVPRGPLQVRDNQFVAGNKLFVVHKEKNVLDCLLDYNKHDVVNLYNINDPEDHRKYRHWTEDQFDNLKGTSWGSYHEYKNNKNYFESLPSDTRNEIMSFHQHSSYTKYVDAPSHTIVGKDLYIDTNNSELYDYQLKALQKNIPNLRTNYLSIGGHNDSCFGLLKPGALLSLNEIQTYENTFPGWDVCYLPDQSFHAIPEFMKMKHKVDGKWWVPGEEENDEFTYFVESWLQDWVGYAEETVFDVNVLVLDEHHVCVNNMNPTVIKFLKKHNIEAVHVPWRHRYFYDGGLHCITLDLKRQGAQQDYFPNRCSGIIDYGFD